MNAFVLFGLALSNGLVGLGGSLVAQHYGFADINIGAGVMIGALASLLLGNRLVHPRSIHAGLVAAVVGSIIYFLAREIGLRLGLNATDLNLATALLVIIALAIPLHNEQLAIRNEAEVSL